MQHLCPECSSDDCERARPEGDVERIARLLGWHVYECLECHHHFYDQSIRQKRLIAAARELFKRGKGNLKAAGERLDRARNLLLWREGPRK
jgi:hypothetical protein